METITASSRDVGLENADYLYASLEDHPEVWFDSQLLYRATSEDSFKDFDLSKVDEEDMEEWERQKQGYIEEIEQEKSERDNSTNSPEGDA